MGIVFFREISSASLLRTMLDVFWSIREGLLLPTWGKGSWYTWTIEDESSASLLRDEAWCANYWGRIFCFLVEDCVFDVLDPLGMVFLMCLNYWRWFLTCLSHWGWFLMCLIWGRVFYFLYCSLRSPLIILCLSGAILRCPSFLKEGIYLLLLFMAKLRVV